MTITTFQGLEVGNRIQLKGSPIIWTIEEEIGGAYVCRCPEGRHVFTHHTAEELTIVPDGLLTSIRYRVRYATNALSLLTGGDPDSDHGAADHILLEFLDGTYPEISAAYRSLKDRASWWATA